MVEKVVLGLTFAVAIAQCQSTTASERRGAAKASAEPLARYSQALLRKMEPRQLVRELEAELEGTAQVVRPHIMARLARAKQEAGQEREVEDAAEAALREVDKNIREMPIFAPTYDAVIFYAHLVLGRAAVSRGDIEDAKFAFSRGGADDAMAGADHLRAEHVARPRVAHAVRDRIGTPIPSGVSQVLEGSR